VLCLSRFLSIAHLLLEKLHKRRITVLGHIYGQSKVLDIVPVHPDPAFVGVVRGRPPFQENLSGGLSFQNPALDGLVTRNVDDEIGAEVRNQGADLGLVGFSLEAVGLGLKKSRGRKYPRYGFLLPMGAGIPST